MNPQEIVAKLARGERIGYENWLSDVLAAPWLQGYWGKRWWRAIGAFADVVEELARQGVRARFPALAPDDVLDVLGRDRLIERLAGIGSVFELDGTLRERISRPFATWGESGRISGVVEGLQALDVIANADVRAYDLASGWTDGNTYEFSRCWAVINQTHPWTELLAADDVYASDETVAGITMSQSQLRWLRILFRKWRAAHAIPVDIIVVFNGVIAAPDTIAADTLIAGGDAVALPVTTPYAADDLYAGDDVPIAGDFIDPIRPLGFAYPDVFDPEN